MPNPRKQIGIKPYYVLSDATMAGVVVGYGVYFEPDDQPGINVQVDDGYFGVTRSRGWQAALAAADNLRDELNTAFAKTRGRGHG